MVDIFVIIITVTHIGLWVQNTTFMDADFVLCNPVPL